VPAPPPAASELAARERRLAERQAALDARERRLRSRERSPAPPAASAAPDAAPGGGAPAAAAGGESDSARAAGPAAEGPAGMPAPAPEAEPRPAVPVTVPAGTRFEVEFTKGLASNTSAVGETFRARVVSDLRLDGAVAIPAGSEVLGVVTDAVGAGRIGAQ